MNCNKEKSAEELMLEFYKNNPEDYQLDKIIHNFIDTIMSDFEVIFNLKEIFGLSYKEIGVRHQRYSVLFS